MWSEPLIITSNELASKKAAQKSSSSSTKKQYYLYSVADAKIIQHHIHLGSGGGSSICGPNTQATNFYKELMKTLGEGGRDDQEIDSIKSAASKSSMFEFGLTELVVLDKYFAIGKYDGSIEVSN